MVGLPLLLIRQHARSFWKTSAPIGGLKTCSFTLLGNNGTDRPTDRPIGSRRSTNIWVHWAVALPITYMHVYVRILAKSILFEFAKYLVLSSKADPVL